MIALMCLLLSAALMNPLPAPDKVTLRMMLVELAENNSLSRSSGIRYHGQCKRFQIDSFATAAAGYTLKKYPGVELYMPMEHGDEGQTGRPTGICWEMPDPSTGNAFVEVDSFDYNRELTLRENLVNARKFLEQVKAGDVIQILGIFSGSARGTHCLMITRNYDPRNEMLFWADSNFSNKRIDGIRYGYVRAYQTRPIDEVAKWIGSSGNTGATIYRISRDVVSNRESE